jgi:hypothetical protein
MAEPLWRGKTGPIPNNPTYTGVYAIWLGEPGTEVAVVPWPLPASERLEALEEIRQRVADGWVPSHEGLCWQHDEELCDPADIKPEVASILWPEDMSGA